MKNAPLALLAAALAVAAPATAADRPFEPATPLAALASLPIKEVTVFKDGHAFVVHGGTMPVDAAGNVVLDDLPVPVMGTFWPFAGEPGARLASVTAGKRRVLVTRTALDMIALLQANLGAEAWIAEKGGPRYPATVLSIPTRSGEELARTALPGTEVPLPQPGRVVLLRTAEGTKVLPLDRIEDVTFKGDAKTAVAGEEMRDLLTMHLDWGGAKRPATASVGMGYLQKGLRWIPSYRVEIDGAGKAAVRLQATLVNDLADIEGVTAHLVIGVPSFDFRETLDPIALQRTLAGLSPYFQTDRGSLTNGALSNNFVVMQQVARAGEYQDPRPRGGTGEETGTPGEKSEDLYVFTVKGISLRKGERMVLPVADLDLAYRDVHRLEIPAAPPVEVRRARPNDPRAADLARLFAAPRPVHLLRLVNTGPAPLTTAPALILRGGQVLGQGTMTYTAPGASVDLPVTAAVDIRVKVTDAEAGRSTEKVAWHDDWKFSRIDFAGGIRITNQGTRPVELEVSREVIGALDAADGGATVTRPDLAGDDGYVSARPWWWGSYSWPDWWARVNGVGRADWTLTLEPGKEVTLGYKWHYLWRW